MFVRGVQMGPQINKFPILVLSWVRTNVWLKHTAVVVFAHPSQRTARTCICIDHSHLLCTMPAYKLMQTYVACISDGRRRAVFS